MESHAPVKPVPKAAAFGGVSEILKTMETHRHGEVNQGATKRQRQGPSLTELLKPIGKPLKTNLAEWMLMARTFVKE